MRVVRNIQKAAPGEMPRSVSRLRRFLRAEDGSLLPLGMTFLVFMMMLGGMALDLMRHEEKRVTLQQTLDRSVLAAASLSQTLNPKSVVIDYFAKAGMSQYLSADDVTVTEGLNYRIVEAEANADIEPFFMEMMGVNDFGAAAGSVAEQRIANVEISLVLDVSGSMQVTSSRIAALKTAAKDFVDTVLKNSGNKISISIVPYAGQVNLGPDLFNQYTGVTYKHGLDKSWCVDLPTTAYNSTALSPTLAMPQSGFFDAFSGYGNNWNDGRTIVPPKYDDSRKAGEFHYINSSCEPLDKNYVRPFSNDIATLKAQIDALQPNGATSIDAGMRWGVALLDPGTNSVIANLAAAGKVNSAFATRPAPFSDRETMKVIVLMTDGENFADRRLNDSYRIAQSNIYRSNGDGKLSIRFPTGRPTRAGSNQYYVPHLCSTTGSSTYCSSSWGQWRSTVYNSGAGTTRLTWNQVWQYATVEWVAMHLYARPLATNQTSYSEVEGKYKAQMNNFRSETSISTMDSRLSTVCTSAKTSGMIVFGIALEATSAGKTTVRNCATSSAHYFETTGATLMAAFRAIAGQISYLRLTQ